MWSVIESLNQNQLGLPNECGFFSLWNSICLINPDMCSQRLDVSAFRQFFSECITVLQNMGVYTSPDLSSLYVEILVENHPLIKSMIDQSKLIILPEMYLFGELILSCEQVRHIETVINSLFKGIPAAMVLSEHGHFYSLYCKDDSNLILCDSLNSRTSLPQDKNLVRFANCIVNHESFSNVYLLCISEHFIEESIRFQREYGFDTWRTIPQPLNSFHGICLSQLSIIAENMSSVITEKSIRGLSPDNIRWIHDTHNTVPENRYLKFLSQITS